MANLLYLFVGFIFATSKKEQLQIRLLRILAAHIRHRHILMFEALFDGMSDFSSSFEGGDVGKIEGDEEVDYEHCSSSL